MSIPSPPPDLCIEFVIVCRCGFITRATPAQGRAGAFRAYREAHMPACPIKTEAWSGWALRLVPPTENGEPVP
jgi:hypothetical protein